MNSKRRFQNWNRPSPLDQNEDPTNYYLLGVANQNAGHFEKAVVAFEKCAAVKSNLQGTCTTAAEQSKKEAAQRSPK
jgi:hypothetical protein